MVLLLLQTALDTIDVRVDFSVFSGCIVIVKGSLLMNKLLVSLVLVSASVIYTCGAEAAPNSIQLGFSCPTVSATGPNNLTNFGWGVAGYGEAFINGAVVPNPPYFTNSIGSSNIPSVIYTGGYASTGTQYDPATGIVGCTYASNTGYASFAVYYKMTNGAGGFIINQTANSIIINQYVGLI